MIPAKFNYIKASSVSEALGLLDKHGDDAQLIAGGHSLLPAMKLRLNQPEVVIDIGKILSAKQLKKKLTAGIIYKIKRGMGIVLILFGALLIIKGFIPKEKLPSLEKIGKFEIINGKN